MSLTAEEFHDPDQFEFSGLICTRKGRCDVKENFSWGAGSTHRGGRPLVILDDLNGVDENGVRTPGTPAPADTTDFHFPLGDDEEKTWGIDGAILEIDDVTIPPGKKLSFQYRFISPETLTGMLCDFALFHAYDQGREDPAHPREHRVLAESFFVPDSGWTGFEWCPKEGFHGKLRWIVSNGIVSVGRPAILEEMKARPSTLLVADIEIV